MDHDHTDIYARLVTVLSDKFEVPADRINEAATLDDLELDSLAVVELYVTLQEEWQVPLDDSTASGDLTVADVSRAVAELLGDPDRGAA
ncbi:acyl carrier protein [Streptomyces lincolnensis]|uniref:Acyl carrier protein n=1 Tax=Streptomyces lincolnensis TaxID=1915 RepID=A0A1B1M3D4_STRLN|nr:acyl carrier protein [Streptomyces lincolnensis]ANS63150.1 acyl carrier protein [Streptomyces lincolnensis]AXG52073.1 acyl carrier protein [Streptomyces lincolnensis]QMV05056.1 acyl carrier protein [Streptomyces lincolnensis]